MESYCRLTKSKRFIGNKPVTFSNKTYNPSEVYWITDKLDGERKFLFFTKGNSYFVSSKSEFDKSAINSSSLDGTILDGELYKDKFYVFDILFYKFKDVRKFKFDYRYKLYQNVVKEIESKQVITSEYQKLTCDDFKVHLRKLRNSKKYDGIIFNSNGDYYSLTLKWKPIRLLSIDFKIKKVKDNTFLLLTQDNKSYTNKDFKDIGKIKVTKEEYDKYRDNSVVEFVFKKGKFVPIRSRPDKIISNHNKVIASNFEQIIKPVNVKKLIC